MFDLPQKRMVLTYCHWFIVMLAVRLSQCMAKLAFITLKVNYLSLNNSR